MGTAWPGSPTPTRLQAGHRQHCLGTSRTEQMALPSRHRCTVRAHLHRCSALHTHLHTPLQTHGQSPIPKVWIHAPFVDMPTQAPRAHSSALYSKFPRWKWSISFVTLRAGEIPHRAGLLLPLTHGGNQVPLPDTVPTCIKLEGVPSCISEWHWPRCQARGVIKISVSPPPPSSHTTAFLTQKRETEA